MEIIYGEASKALKQKALNLGANAIVGFRVDFDEISGKDKSMFMVSVSGTACIIEMNNKELSEEEIIRTSISQSDLQKEIDRRYIISQIKDAVPLTSEWVEFFTGISANRDNRKSYKKIYLHRSRLLCGRGG